MKKILAYGISLMLVMGCSAGKRELFTETDAFVQSLQATYESEGLIATPEQSTKTPDGLYLVTPIGRLVNVKILQAVSDKEYEELREDLEEHYKNDSRVNQVYICEAGTVMIDCRR